MSDFDPLKHGTIDFEAARATCPEHGAQAITEDRSALCRHVREVLNLRDQGMSWRVTVPGEGEVEVR